MDQFSLARPNTEEGASQGAQSCKAYVSSRFAFRVTASWGTQSHNAVASSGFEFGITASWGAQSYNTVVSSGFACKSTCIICYTMVACDCVSRGTPRAAFSCALRGQKNICMDPRVPVSAPIGPTGIPGIFDF